jgi:hypothetical protein
MVLVGGVLSVAARLLNIVVLALGLPMELAVTVAAQHLSHRVSSTVRLC